VCGLVNGSELSGGWDPHHFSDHALALLELRLDPAFHRIAPDAYDVYVNGALSIGREAATEYAGCNPSDLAVRRAATIVYSDVRMEVAGQLVRSEYDSCTRMITVYLPSVAEVEERLKTGLNRHLPTLACHGRWLRPGLVADIHIAHELFHHLEATAIGRTDERMPRVVTKRIGPFTIASVRVRRCREIAAHMFAKELLALPFYPNAIDLWPHESNG
jgi:hypothetical protein